MNRAFDIFVVGGGPAGLSAGIYGARTGLNVGLAEMSVPGGQIASTDRIDNYPGISSMQGFEFGEALRTHAEESGCSILYDEASSIDKEDDGSFRIRVGEDNVAATSVVYAAGSSPRRAGFTGESEFTGRGVSYCATCDGGFYRGRPVFVVGGGMSACEEALYLSRLTAHVTIVVRGTKLKAVDSIRARVKSAPNIEVRYNTRVTRVEGQRLLERVVLSDVVTGAETLFDFEPGGSGVFVLVGTEPRVTLVRDLVDVVDSGISTDRFMGTRTAGLFAAGDVRDTTMRQVITAASDGAKAAMSAYRYVTDLA